MLLEPRMSSGSQELSVSLDDAVTSSRMPPPPTVSEQPLSSPCERPHPTLPTAGCDSSSWKPGVAFRDEGFCYDSSGEDDLAVLTYHFTTEEQEGNTPTSEENPSFPQFLKRLAKVLGFHLIPFRELTGTLVHRYLD